MSRKYVERHVKQVVITVQQLDDGTYYLLNNAVPVHRRIVNDINELFKMSDVLHKKFNDGTYDSVYVKFTMEGDTDVRKSNNCIS